MIFLPSVVLPFPWRAVCLPVLTEHTPVSRYNYKTRVGFTQSVFLRTNSRIWQEFYQEKVTSWGEAFG